MVMFDTSSFKISRSKVQNRTESTSVERVYIEQNQKVLKMEYNTQNYWVSGLCLSCGIVNTRKHNVSETGSVSILRWRRETPTLLSPVIGVTSS
jgi:hypothetical protein